MLIAIAKMKSEILIDLASSLYSENVAKERSWAEIRKVMDIEGVDYA